MAVRIKVEIIRNKIKVRSAALVNSGYETEEPELLIPVNLAKKLKIYPKLPPNTTIEDYFTAGEVTQLYFMPQCVKVRIVTKDRKTEEIISNLTVSTNEAQILLSDKLCGKFGIVIEDISEGLWRFKDDPISKLRKSEKRQLW